MMPHPTSVPVSDGVITGVVLDADIVLGRTESDGVAGGAAGGASAGDGAVGAIVTANTGVDKVFKLTGSDPGRIIAAITVYFQTLKNVQLSDKQIFTVFIKEIMHCARNLQIIH